MYTRITYTFPDGLEIYEYHSARYGAPGEKREKKSKPTPEQVKAQNQRNRVRDIRHLIRMNFDEQDYWITLTYQRKARPPNIEAAKHEAELFRKRLKRIYDKAGVPMRWIQKTEIGKKGAVHHHMVLNRIPDLDQALAKKWKHGRVHFSLLYQDGGFEKLAEYIAKQEGAVYDYSRSRNLKKPKKKKQTMKRRTFEKEPRRKGYELEKGSMVEGISPMGWPFRSYRMNKIRGSTKRRNTNV